MTWIIKHAGMTFSSDDFLIEDLDSIEKASGEPWSIGNPLRSIKVARAFLAAAMIRSGKPEAEVAKALEMLTLKSLKRAFEYVADEDEELEGEHEEPDPSVPSLDPTSRASSPGARPKAGRPAKRAKSA